MNILKLLIIKMLDAINLPPPPVPKDPIPPRPVKKDKDAPNLFVGKIMDDDNIKCEVVDVHNTNIHVKILEIKWVRLGTYLDVGKVYPVFMHSNKEFFGDDMQIWEIAPKHMKRDTSQVLLVWEKDLGWTWDLDM